MSTVQELEQAISTLSPEERSELRLRLDANHGQPFDDRRTADFGAGLLDDMIQSALKEEVAGRTRPL